MTIRAQFNKAVRRALKRSYQPLKGARVTTFSSVIRDDHAYIDFRVVKNGDETKKELKLLLAMTDVIFDPVFAAAVWGDAPIRVRSGEHIDGKDPEWPDKAFTNWQYHLQQMVILPTTTERLKYLGANL
jgi:hypothetical protein